MEEWDECLQVWVDERREAHTCIRVSGHSLRDNGLNSPHLCHCGTSREVESED